MNYLIYSSQTPLIKARIRRITKNHIDEPDDMNFIRFNMDDVDLATVIDEISSLPLGYDNKIVSLENCSYLVKEDKKTKEDKIYQTFLSILESNNPNIHIIVSINSLNIDKKSNIYLALSKEGSIIEIVDPDENTWIKYIKTQFEEKREVQIDKDALNEIASRTKGDIDLLLNSADKLSLYTDHVTLKDVDLMVEAPIDDNVFHIYNYLLQSRNELAVKIFKDMTIYNVEPIRLIVTLANQFRLQYNVLTLNKQGKNSFEISKELSISEPRARILIKQSYLLSESTIRATLEQLHQLDFQIKSGQVDRYYAFELFLINFKVH